VLVSPETVKEEITPAKYKTVRRWVLEEDGRTEAEKLPAHETQMKYAALVQAPSVQPQSVEARTENIPVRTHTGIPQPVLRSVVCERDLSTSLVKKVQAALVSAGEDPGTPDGKLGQRTWRAIQSYQASRSLAVRLLSFETIEALGITPE
jgi:hypothetical protein